MYIPVEVVGFIIGFLAAIFIIAVVISETNQERE